MIFYMTKQLHNSDHEQIGLLLPWFVNKTLDDNEHDTVKRHIAECSECQEEVALLTRLQSVVKSGAAKPIVPKPSVQNLMDSLDKPAATKGWWTQGWLVAASVAILLLTSVTYFAGQKTDPGSPPLFETATSELDAGAMDYVLILQFSDDANAADRERIFREIGATDISPSEDGVGYRVIAPLTISTLEEAQVYTDSVTMKPEVESVKVVAIQLPVKRDP